MTPLCTFQLFRVIIGAPRLNNRDGSIFGCLVNGNDHTCSQLAMSKPSGTDVGGETIF